MKVSPAKTSQKLDKAYFELVRRFPLQTLASDKDLDAAIEVINLLVDRGFENLTAGEEAYLDVLSDIVEKYETEHHPIPDASPAKMLQFLIEDRKTNQRTVAKGAGIPTSTMSQLLSGQRELNINHIERLTAFFGVRPEVFIRTAPVLAPAKAKSSSTRRRGRNMTPGRPLSQKPALPRVAAAKK